MPGGEPVHSTQPTASRRSTFQAWERELEWEREWELAGGNWPVDSSSRWLGMGGNGGVAGAGGMDGWSRSMSWHGLWLCQGQGNGWSMTTGLAWPEQEQGLGQGVGNGVGQAAWLCQGRRHEKGDARFPKSSPLQVARRVQGLCQSRCHDKAITCACTMP